MFGGRKGGFLLVKEKRHRYHVSNAHRDALGAGCIVAALASDVARHNSPELLRYVEKTISIYIENIVAALPDVEELERRRIALAVLAEMVGAVILARVTRQKLAQELVETVVEDLLERHSKARIGNKGDSFRSSRRKVDRTGPLQNASNDTSHVAEHAF
jgi:hypothetical protein